MRIKSINPYTGEVNQTFDLMSYEACEQSVQRARDAFGQWRRLPVSERVKPVARLASILRDRKRELGAIATREMGKPIRQSITEIEKCALLCDYYFENAEKFLRDETVATSCAKSYVTFEPLGVILGIMPWNFPFWQVVRWAVPSVAAGNTCLLKHASNVPITALETEKLFAEAGFPKDVFQTLLIGSGTAGRLIEADMVDGISLTGSVQAGSEVAALSGRHLKKLVLELGGSDPFIVLADADLDKAASAALTSRTANAGQSCIAAKRFIVAESVVDAFVEKFREALGRMKIGDPMNDDTDMGPVAREEFLKDLNDQLRDAEAGGAVVHRGPAVPERGFFFQPVILTGIRQEMKVFAEEVFGPIAPVLSVKSEEEMLRIANDTEFGLGAAVWTRDTAKGERFAKEIASGFVAINGIVKSDPRLPFGGVKKSGFGRELSHYGLKEFVNIKTVIIGR